ncbi:Prophage CP4-57 integrase [Thalassovita gelatinovora]|uniref:Prophage CP4-57 integrase n=1 Tax=Thalassovita gelatinovora TaxID=53501 RepID=A0A0P1FBY5_THAGE|nr:integrase arm-type DNA-binding domain-containing protein [Thalassovita gelatinovora]QIZ80037.1 tyrosine-type recombinase/integrase [Thalassovita gelatinovora]CUH65742.1 Prophage CP4-57 integrase [Thalassovita gelatinovora]SER04067.1 Integrase [Thalassovita gelatinovora]
MPLSDIQIRNLKSKEKAYKVSDFEGLFLLIKVSGAKSWRFKYRIDGKEKLLVIGDYPAISLALARKTRDSAKAQLAEGIDPNEFKQEEKRVRLEAKGQTFAKIGVAFLDKQRKEGKTKATLDKTEYHLRLANKDFGRKPISEITAPMILKTLRKVEAKGNYETAHRLRARIGSVFRYAVASGIADTDPTYALRDALIRPTRVHRAAITDPKALGQLLREIELFDGQATTRIGLQMLALLAQRPGEIRHAKWSEFDIEEKVWAIPAGKMKMRRDHSVPLPDQALALLDELRPITGEGEYLFPSLRSWHRPMSENTLNAALRRMGYSGEEMTAHGFRASFSTLANESGLWNPDAIERALAHVEKNEVRRAYARGEHWDERIRLAGWWAGYLDDVRAN